MRNDLPPRNFPSKAGSCQKIVLNVENLYFRTAGREEKKKNPNATFNPTVISKKK